MDKYRAAQALITFAIIMSCVVLFYLPAPIVINKSKPTISSKLHIAIIAFCTMS